MLLVRPELAGPILRHVMAEETGPTTLVVVGLNEVQAPTGADGSTECGEDLLAPVEVVQPAGAEFERPPIPAGGPDLRDKLRRWILVLLLLRISVELVICGRTGARVRLHIKGSIDLIEPLP
jgi:hypothetical protein